jgi:hypothetical protein
MINKDIFNQHGLWAEDMWMCEDYELWLRLSNIYEFGFLNRSLIVKRGGHSDQLSKSFIPIEKYRLQALEKILDSQALIPQNQKLALATYTQKANIFINGCLKRGKNQEASVQQKKLAIYLNHA